jgi:hypothetical protein
MNKHEKPYYSLDTYLKETYGEKIYKISLDPGFTCPNRDGTLSQRGCIFCSEGGSGDFSSTNIEEGIKKVAHKFTGHHYIAYFQAYTNTYGPISKLKELYQAALNHPLIIGISIATRPDCLGDEVLSLLQILRLQYPTKFIWIELGLQTIHEQTALYIRRGYDLPCFEEAVKNLQYSNTYNRSYYSWFTRRNHKRLYKNHALFESVTYSGIKITLTSYFKKYGLSRGLSLYSFPNLFFRRIQFSNHRTFRTRKEGHCDSPYHRRRSKELAYCTFMEF